MVEFHLILVDPQPLLCSALGKAFARLPRVEVVNDHFETLPEFDCMVSAANSFGLMDGGVDAAIVRFFGIHLMQRVQHHILTEYLGEQPVGTSFIIETDDVNHPFVAHTPTMRVPMDIAHTDNVYLAMWAMLRAVHHHNHRGDRPIRTVACPGLGTLTGRVSPEVAARQMALAYRHYLNPPQRLDWVFADLRDKAVQSSILDRR